VGDGLIRLVDRLLEHERNLLEPGQDRASRFLAQCIEQEVLQGGMQGTVRRHAHLGRDERHVVVGDVARQVDHALGKCQQRELGMQGHAGLGALKPDEVQAVIAEQALDRG